MFDWIDNQVVYSCRIGETSIFSLKFPGFKASPGVFEVPFQKLTAPSNYNKNVYFGYSLPCNEELKPGVYRIGKFISHVETVYRHFYVDTSGCFENYLKHFTGKVLNQLKRKIKKVETSNKNGITFNVYQHSSDVEEFFTRATSISRKTYQEKLLGLGLPTNDKFKEKMKTMARKGMFRGYILYAEDQPVAYNLCPINDHGILLYDYTGYDPAYAKYSVGNVLQFKVIEQAFSSSNILIYDLCTGEGHHKEIFATGFKTCCDVYYFPASLYFGIVVYTKVAIEKASALLINFLGEIGVKDKIKKFIRRNS